jgi:hypothetical protein
MNEFEPLFERQVLCYCKTTMVISRRDPSKDRWAVCSVGCWEKMLNEGMHEPGSLYREWVGSNVTGFYTT